MAPRSARVALLQFTPCYADPAASRAKAEAICSSLSLEDGIDLLVAPEMCLTGYIFDSAEQVRSLCEARNESEGVTIEMAKALSKRLGCYTLMGFPEVVRTPDVEEQNCQAFDARPTSNVAFRSYPRWHNSAVLVSPDGSIVHVFRKHFLFSTSPTAKDRDTLWANEGPGFQCVDLPNIGRLAVGICMDLNPYRFEELFEKYELATWCREQEVDVLALPMAWLSSRPNHDAGGEDDPDFDVINYWAVRCMPLWRQERKGKSTLFVAVNRTGKERGELRLPLILDHILTGTALPVPQRPGSPGRHVFYVFNRGRHRFCSTASRRRLKTSWSAKLQMWRSRLE